MTCSSPSARTTMNDLSTDDIRAAADVLDKFPGAFDLVDVAIRHDGPGVLVIDAAVTTGHLDQNVTDVVAHGWADRPDEVLDADLGLQVPEDGPLHGDARLLVDVRRAADA